MANFQCSRCPKGCVKVERDDSVFSAHLCTYGDLLAAILSDSLAGSFLEGLGLSASIIQQESFEAWLSNQFHKACESPVSKEDAARVVGSMKELDALLRSGLIHRAKWQRSLAAVDGHSLRDFMLKNRPQAQHKLSTAPVCS